METSSLFTELYDKLSREEVLALVTIFASWSVALSAALFAFIKWHYSQRLEENKSSLEITERKLKNANENNNSLTSELDILKTKFEVISTHEEQLNKHDHAIKTYKFMFSNSKLLNQTMFTPKYTAISDDMVFEDDWLKRDVHITRVYGVNNSVDLESAKNFSYKVESELDGQRDKVDIRLIEMLDLPMRLRGKVPNVTLSNIGESSQSVAVSVPELAKGSVSRAVFLSEKDEVVRLWNNYYTLFSALSKPYLESVTDIEKKIDLHNKAFVYENVLDILRQLDKKCDLNFGAAFVGSFIGKQNKGWIHRDIDLLIVVSEGCSWSELSIFKEQFSIKINEIFNSDSRRAIVDFNDGPVKVMPNKSVETWQFHVLIDTHEHVIDWPLHVKLRRRINIHWLEVGDVSIVEDLKSLLIDNKSSDEKLRDIIDRGFGLKHCLEILKDPKYHYREITGSFNDKIIRKSKTSYYLFSDNTNSFREKVWRDSFLLHYCVYNFCFNFGILLEMRSGNLDTYVEKQENLSLVVNVMRDALSKQEFSEFSDVVNIIEQHSNDVRSEFIFPAYEVAELESRFNDLHDKTENLRLKIITYLSSALTSIESSFSQFIK